MNRPAMPKRTVRLWILCLVPALIALHVATTLTAQDTRKSAPKPPSGVVKHVVRLMHPSVRDQDDMCFWQHPTDPAKSLVITSDKFGNHVYVYDLEGKNLQVLSTRFPGNIDSRKGFPLGGKKVDIVVWNQRDRKAMRLRVYKVNPETRQIECIDGGKGIPTGRNYGGCLYHSRKTGKFYFFTTSKLVKVTQFELFDSGTGQVTGREVRGWKIGKCEGAVADDATGKLYVGRESTGVFCFDAEPDAPTTGKLIARVGTNGLVRDVEGVTLLPTGEKTGYIIVSSQGNHLFKVYRRQEPHEFVGTFNVAGTVLTDGVDVIGGNFGEKFPEGIFACHTGREGQKCPVLLSSWKDIKAILEKE